MRGNELTKIVKSFEEESNKVERLVDWAVREIEKGTLDAETEKNILNYLERG